MAQVEKWRIYEEPIQEVIDASSGWAFLDTGHFPYDGNGFDWGSLMYNRESVFIKNQGAAPLLLWYCNFIKIDVEYRAVIEWNDGAGKWYLTLPVQVSDDDNPYRNAGSHFDLTDGPVSGSPAIIFNNEVKTILDGVAVLEVDGATEKVYSFDLLNERGLRKDRSIIIQLEKSDIPPPVDADAFILEIGGAIGLDYTHDVVVFMKDSEAVYFLQLR